MNVTLVDEILDAAEGSLPQVVLKPIALETERQNQFLLLFKPECFQRPTRHHARGLLNMIFAKLLLFQLEICGLILISGERLSEMPVIDRHYGYINFMSRNASIELAGASAHQLRELLNAPRDARILGGHELLAQHPSLEPDSLNDLWSTKPAMRLRSGLYAELHRFDAQPIVIVNGFHPKQLTHFNSPGTHTAMLIAHSDLPWRALRLQMIGDTFPERAASGSIRRTLWDRRIQFGFRYVDESNNCDHMSSGPFEALAEIHNFLAAAPEESFDIEACRQIRHVRAAGWKADSACLVSNPTLTVGGCTATLNDLTEGTDGYSSAHLAVKFLKQLYGP